MTNPKLVSDYASWLALFYTKLVRGGVSPDHAAQMTIFFMEGGPKA
jgi:hypothetical protein